MKKLLYILLFCTCEAYATHPLDSNYIQDLSDSLIIRIYGLQKFSTVSIHDELKEVAYAPISGINVGFGFAYKWIGINLALGLPGTYSHGGDVKSKGLDLRIHSYGRRFGFDASYSELSGFALENITIPNSSSVATFRPDLYTQQLAFSGYFNLKPSKFSLRAITLQNERQLKSTGAPIVGLYANRMRCGTRDSMSVIDRALIPAAELNRYFNESLHFKELHMINIGLHFGYIYTFVAKEGFFSSLGLSLGAGYNNSKYSYIERDPIQLSELQIFATGRFAIGYNTEKFYAGFITNFELNSLIVQDRYSVNFTHGTVRLVIAKRFSGKFKFLNKMYKTKVAKTLAPRDKK